MQTDVRGGKMNTLVKRRRLTGFPHGSFRLSLALMPALTLALFFGGCAPARETALPQEMEVTAMKLPEPKYDSGVSLEQTLLKRRSVRDYADESLSLEQVSQLLWAAQGITDQMGHRTAPSAGALYPLEMYVVAGDVRGLSSGVYHYEPDGHQLTKTIEGDRRADLAAAALSQSSVRDGAIDIIFTAIYERTTRKYGERGIRYVHMEAGHAAQNVCLQAVALNLGTVTVGAFDDDRVREILKLPPQEQPLYILPVGR